MIHKYLPFVNFLIATTALGFQITVLYPWHYELQQEFNELQKQQEEKLRLYHELKMQTIKNIESTTTTTTTTTGVVVLAEENLCCLASGVSGGVVLEEWCCGLEVRSQYCDTIEWNARI